MFVELSSLLSMHLCYDKESGVMKKYLHDQCSDEPARVNVITGSVFSQQSGNWDQVFSNGTRVVLDGGADKADDAAWFSTNGPIQIVLASDYVRGTGFQLFQSGLLNYYDIGYYLVGANISDIAAMGATPGAFMSVIRYPLSLTDTDFLKIVYGIRDACANFKISNVGGDIGSADQVILSGSAIGFTANGVLSRQGAQVGDYLVLGGDTGVAAAAQKYYCTNLESTHYISPDLRNEMKQRWRRVSPQIKLGKFLLDNRIATSCMDTSDGLKAAVEELSRQSQVGFVLDEPSIPFNECIVSVCGPQEREEQLKLIFGASVDFRLLFTIPPDDDLLKSVSDRFPTVRKIGIATASIENVLHNVDGSYTTLPGEAWRHIR